jgi:hypothetical protein
MQTQLRTLCVFWTGRESHGCLGDTEQGRNMTNLDAGMKATLQSWLTAFGTPGRHCVASHSSSFAAQLTRQEPRPVHEQVACEGRGSAQTPPRSLRPGVTMPCGRDSTEAPPPVQES